MRKIYPQQILQKPIPSVSIPLDYCIDIQSFIDLGRMIPTPRQKVCFAWQVDASIRECRAIIGVPNTNPLLGSLNDAKLPKCAEE
jgi:hypothetical protein